MMLNIPAGAHIHISFGQPGPVAAPPPAPASPRRSWFPAIAGLVLLVGAFQVGRFASSVTAPARATVATRVPPLPGEQHAFPDHNVPRNTAASPNEVPLDFRQQLALPPQVTPPPGQPAQPAGAGHVDAFGLQH